MAKQIAKKNLPDKALVLTKIPVNFKDKTTAKATAEGNNTAWICKCGELLTGRCYYQFGWRNHTICPQCGKVYRVKGDAKKKAIQVNEE